MSSILKVDTLQENTSANGITVDGLNIKDSKLVTADSVVTSNITDLNITSGKIADDAITLDKMASGTDGNLITYDASGNPAAVATGSAGQVLTSAGAGAPPTFATAAAGGMLGWGVVTLDGDLAINSAGVQYINSNQTARNLSKTNFISVSSGVISFLETGWYKVDYLLSVGRVSDNGEYVRGIISRSTNGGSSFSDIAYSYGSVDSAADRTNIYISAIIDVGDVSAFKIAMGYHPENASRCKFFGTGMPVTAMIFTKLGET